MTIIIISNRQIQLPLFIITTINSHIIFKSILTMILDQFSYLNLYLLFSKIKIIFLHSDIEIIILTTPFVHLYLYTIQFWDLQQYLFSL